MDKIKEIIDKLLGKDKDTPSEGFTLIELLVVIAVIGVLAAALLLAINPLEQIRRAQDSGTKQQVASVARSVEAYYVNSAAGTTAQYPAGVNDWLSGDLSGEFKTVPSNSNLTSCPSGEIDNGYCLFTGTYNGDPHFLVYTALTNDSDYERAQCTGTTYYYMYTSTQGRAGIVCTIPSLAASATVTLY